jgi:uncharacterized membrane protein YedE/YeeE
MTIMILFYGFLFGAILQSAKLNRFNTISGMATLENYKVAKAIALAIGVGVILLNIEIGLGFASYHTKPVILGGVVWGGLIFGAGMAILGYCPGTMIVSLGEGSLDAAAGLFGGLLGGLVYTLVLPFIGALLGPDLGTFSLYSLTGSSPVIFYSLVVMLGALFIAIAFFVHKIEKVTDRTWIFAGVALAILNSIIFLKIGMDRPIGASTAYPYFADLISGNTENQYFEKIVKAGGWEVIFLGGTFLAGVIISVLKKEFKIELIHSAWSKYKGNSVVKRLFWAIFGGFILIFGARMAGGCTSGHVISGGMQLALSSMIFAIFVFAGLLTTGRLFYKKH